MSAARMIGRAASRSAWSRPCCGAESPPSIAGTSRVSDQVAAAVMGAYHQRLSVGEPPAIALAGAITRLAGGRHRPGPVHLFRAGM